MAQHLFFDEDGNAMWAFSTKVKQEFVFRHPRVLLDYLRFIDSYNETATTSEFYTVPRISPRVARHLLSHSSITNPAPEFADTVWELKQRLKRYVF
jgi:hypothetical protein